MLVFAWQAQGQCDGTQMNKAAFSNDVVGLESLISLGHDPNEMAPPGVDCCGMRPLHCAGIDNATGSAKVLIDAKADVNATSRHPVFAALHSAAYWCSPGVAELLLKSGAFVDARNSDARTPLLEAANSGCAAVAAILVRWGADVEAADVPDGRRAMHWAAEGGFTETMQVLLRAGASPDSRLNGDGCTGCVGSTPLHRAAHTGKLEAVRLLLKHCDVNSMDSYWQTPLHYASAAGHLKTVKFLVDAGANPTLEGFDSRTAKEVAMSRDKADVASYLSAYDLSPLDRASRSVQSVRAWLSVAAALIASGAAAPYFARRPKKESPLSAGACVLASISAVPAGWKIPMLMYWWLAVMANIALVDLLMVTVQPMCWCVIVVLVYAGPAACRYGWGILEEVPVTACMANLHLLNIQHARGLRRLGILVLASRPFLLFGISQWVTWGEWQWRPNSWDAQHWSNSVASAFNVSFPPGMMAPSFLCNEKGAEVLYGIWPLVPGVPQVVEAQLSAPYHAYVDALAHSYSSDSQELLAQIGHREAVRMILKDGILEPTLQKPLSRTAAMNVLVFTILLASVAWGILLLLLLLACRGRVLHSKGPSKVAALAAEIEAVIHSAGTIEERKAFMIFLAAGLNMYQWAVLMGNEDYSFAAVVLFFEILRGITDVALFLLNIYKVPFSSHSGKTAWPGVASIFMSSYFIAGYLLEKLDCCTVDAEVDWSDTSESSSGDSSSEDVAWLKKESRLLASD
ncbi:ANK2 [Symbiodinium sp. CCMP2592]|nr:ANK2 [Symbiodinium sp. CCMP2592]